MTLTQKNYIISIMDISTIDILFGDDIMAKEQLKTLTEPMYYILLTLSEPQHGYGIMQEVERRTEGRVKIGAGTLYNLLSRFEDENIIVQISEENRRKTYTLTDKGLNILMDEYQRLKQLVSDGSNFLEGRAR
ncbi:MAG TPA: helix-turn-helix transcriptional regulator [Sedimentibacter sp.]|nr:helix-turn-helix transcriptional regulator [Sedimentibacter sp.]